MAHEEKTVVGYSQPDHAGLQVVEQGGLQVVESEAAPEVDYSHSYPEAVGAPGSYDTKHDYAYAQAPLTPYKADYGADETDTPPAPSPPSRPWWRRKRWLLGIGGLLVAVIISVVVGVVVSSR